MTATAPSFPAAPTFATAIIRRGRRRTAPALAAMPRRSASIEPGKMFSREQTPRPASVTETPASESATVLFGFAQGDTDTNE